MLDAGYSMLDTRYFMVRGTGQNSRYKVEGLGYRVKSDPFHALFLRSALCAMRSALKSQIPNRNHLSSVICSLTSVLSCLAIIRNVSIINPTIKLDEITGVQLEHILS